MKSLRVADRVPELADDAEPRPLEGGPQCGREKERGASEARAHARERDGEERREESARKRRGKQQEVCDPRGELRVVNHREREPVAGEVEEECARQPAEQKRLRRARPPGDDEKQGDECYPRERPRAEVWEGEREQERRGDCAERFGERRS